MKRIKFPIISLLIIFYSSSLAQVITIKGGGNLNQFIYENVEYAIFDNAKSYIGFHAGITSEFHLKKSIFIETGLIYTKRGTREKANAFEDVSRLKIILNYLNIPINILFKSNKNKKTKFYGGIGLYTSYGFNGKYKFESFSINKNPKSEIAIKWGRNKNEDDFRRRDYGFNFLTGIETNRIKIGFNYSLGLKNILANQNNNAKIRKKALDLTFGIKIGKHKSN